MRKTKEQSVKEVELEGRGYQTWTKARSDNKYEEFQSVLEEIVALKKEIACVTQPDMTSYDSNLDQFERGMKAGRLEEIFSSAKAQLVPLIKQIAASQTKKSYRVPEPLKGGSRWAVDTQAAMCKEIAEKIGFDFSKGRLDVSVHPFTGALSMERGNTRIHFANHLIRLLLYVKMKSISTPTYMHTYMHTYIHTYI
jgi:carboxypeptidase Taq